MDIKTLTKDDIGRWVRYKDGTGGKEDGRIKSWNDNYIFVVYHCNNEWSRFYDFTGAGTNPSDLEFITLENL